MSVEVHRIYPIGELEDGLRLRVSVTSAGAERMPVEFRQFDLDCLDDDVALAPDDRPTLRDDRDWLHEAGRMSEWDLTG